jgi:hypothetical protein
MRPAAGFLDFFHHMLDAARPVAALAIPEADEVDLVRPEARSGFQHPQIVAFIGPPSGGAGRRSDGGTCSTARAFALKKRARQSALAKSTDFSRNVGSSKGM